MTISVIGLGYIGIPLAALIAKSGQNVLGYDSNKTVVENINNGISKIQEDDFVELLSHIALSGLLKAETVLNRSDVYIIAVPTPVDERNQPDLSAVYKSIDLVLPLLEPKQIIIIESTIPVGATKSIFQYIQKSRPDLVEDGETPKFSLAYCPERILPGNILKELNSNQRIIGGLTTRCTQKATEFYSTFLKVKLYQTDCNTAEFIKLAENSFRDLNIAFANELSMMAEAWGVDVFQAIRLANKHPRVNILEPGPGVGGHCLAVDPLFLVANAKQYGDLIKTARMVNDTKPHFVLNQVRARIENLDTKEIESINVGIFGVAYKANSNDLRNSPALQIAKEIIKMPFEKIFVVEPNISELPETLISSTTSFESVEFCLKNADLLIVLVSHKEFLEIDKSALQEIELIDAVNLIGKIGNL